jgi:hypothetical protein
MCWIFWLREVSRLQLQVWHRTDAGYVVGESLGSVSFYIMSWTRSARLNRDLREALNFLYGPGMPGRVTTFQKRDWDQDRGTGMF